MAQRSTFTFITLVDRDYGDERTVILRGELSPVGDPRPVCRTRHLDRFIKGRNAEIVSMFQYDALNLKDAVDWLGNFEYIARNPNGHFWEQF